MPSSVSAFNILFNIKKSLLMLSCFQHHKERYICVITTKIRIQNSYSNFPNFLEVPLYSCPSTTQKHWQSLISLFSVLYFVFSRMSRSRIIKYLTLRVSIMPLWFTMLFQVSVVYCFLLLGSSPLYGRSTIFLSVYLSKGICIIFSFGGCK